MTDHGILQEDRIPACRKHSIAFISLLLLILIAYSNSFEATWHLDDVPNIVENSRSHLKTFSWGEIKNALFASPASGSVDFLRPLPRFSFALNYYFGGHEVFGYHLVNLVIHVFASFFLYLFLSSVFRFPAISARYGPTSFSIAFLASVLWAIHPIQTQAVTYIVQRMASMAGMFYIMGFYFYAKSRLSRRRRAQVAFFAASAISGLLSLGSKENGILFPAGIFLFRLLIVQGFTTENLKKTLKDFSIKYLLPLVVALALLFAFHDVIDRIFALYAERTFTPWERILTEQRVLLLYLSLLIYPLSTRFSIDHCIGISSSLLNPPSTLLSLLGILGILIAACLLIRKEPLITFSVLFFFLNHLMESTVLPMELVFEHRNYIPSMFFFVPIAIGIQRLFLFLSHRRPMQAFVMSCVLLLFMTFGYSTYLRNAAWKDERSLWTDCLQRYPSSFRAHQNLGRAYSLLGNDKRAEVEYELALESPAAHSHKEKGITYFNLGFLAHQRGDLEQAGVLYRKAIDIHPCCPGAHNNLAGILLAESFDQAPEALSLLERAIGCRRDSETALAWSNKSILLWRLGRAEEALIAVEKASELDPDSPLNLLRMGYMQKEKGDFATAALYFRRALELSPGDIAALLHLAEAYLRSEQIGAAKSTIIRLVNSVPADELMVYAKQRREQRGKMEIDPDMEFLLPFLEQTRNEQGQGRRRDPYSEGRPVPSP